MTDERRVRQFLAQAARRVSLIAAVAGAAAGFAVAMLVAREPALGVGVAGIGAMLGAAIRRPSMSAAARRVERRAPSCRNLVITAWDVSAGAARTTPAVAALVYRDASSVIGRLDVGALFPPWKAVAALAGSTVLWAAVSFSDRLPTALQPFGAIGGGVAIRSVEVVVTPPPYAGGAPRTLRDPARIEALAGSRLSFTVRANAARAAIETLDGAVQLVGSSAAGFTAEITAGSDGFVAITAADSAGTTARRLIGLTVVPDAAPRVRITAPGRDLFIDSVRGALDVTIEADDDLALDSLALRYTKVSGSGEQFTFVEGAVPLVVNRVAAGRWTARGVLPLPGLALGPGDVVVYRGIARDRRPGASAAESDAFLVELASPVGAVAGGFAIDDQDDRYGVSQQMVIQMTERLNARRSELGDADFTRESQTLAAAQRRVRAEFVFMLGGELAEDVGTESGLLELHEEAHAAADEDEAIAGRLRSQGRLDLLRAIRAMSRAATALNEGDPTRALPDEREALTMLQRAFSRTRYILRTLTERERIDLDRRLTGSLSTAVRDARPSDSVQVTQRIRELRRVLADIAGLAGAIEVTSAESDRLAGLAQALLREGASSHALQSVATLLTDASAAIGRADADSARALFDNAAVALAAILRAELRAAPSAQTTIADRAVAGALADLLNARGPGR